MSYKYDFADNKTVSAADLNGIISTLGENCTPSLNFSDDGSYAVNRLNLIRSDILSAGVLSGMNCTVTDDGACVATGICIFPSGMRLEITEPEILTLYPDVKNYVYMYGSPLCTAAMPVISKEAKTGDDFIPIAEIENGTATDKRKWSQAKIPLKTSSRAVQTETVTYTSFYGNEFKLGGEVELSNPGFCKILVYLKNQCCGVYDRATSTFIYTANKPGNFLMGIDSEYMVTLVSTYTNAKIKLGVSGTKLQIFSCIMTDNSTKDRSLSVNMVII